MLLGSSLLLGIIYFNSPLYGMDFVSNTEVISKPQDQTEKLSLTFSIITILPPKYSISSPSSKGCILL